MTDELKTQVFMVKTPEDKDAVIVSFVDDDDVNGIYLYEPGADPLELYAVGVDQPGNAFEHGVVTTSRTDDETDWPGEEMVLASALDEVRDDAQEKVDVLTAELDTAMAVLDKLVEAARLAHDEGSVTYHHGVFRWCQHPVCVAVRETAPAAGE